MVTIVISSSYDALQKTGIFSNAFENEKWKPIGNNPTTVDSNDKKGEDEEAEEPKFDFKNSKVYEDHMELYFEFSVSEWAATELQTTNMISYREYYYKHGSEFVFDKSDTEMNLNMNRDFRNAMAKHSDSWMRYYGLTGLMQAKKIHTLATSGVNEYLSIFQKDLTYSEEDFVVLNYGVLPLTPTYEAPKYNIKGWTDNIKEGFDDVQKAYSSCDWVEFFQKFEKKVNILVHQPDKSNTTTFNNNEDYLQSWALINSQNQYLLGRAMHSHMIAKKLKLGILNASVQTLNQNILNERQAEKMLHEINDFLRSTGYKAGITMQNIYKQTVAISRILHKDKVVIILFVPKVPIHQEIDDTSGDWNPTISRMYEMLAAMDFGHLKSLLAMLDQNDIDKLNTLTSLMNENDIQKLKKVISVFNNDQVDKLEQILKRFDTADKLTKVLQNFDDNGNLKKIDISSFQNPVLTQFSKINMEKLENLFFLLTESVNGWNSIGFEKLQTAGIPIINILMLLSTGVLFKKNKIPYLPYDLPGRQENANDIEMGNNIELQTLKTDFAQLKADFEKLKKSIKNSNTTHPGARESEPDSE